MHMLGVIPLRRKEWIVDRSGLAWPQSLSKKGGCILLEKEYFMSRTSLSHDINLSSKVLCQLNFQIHQKNA